MPKIRLPANPKACPHVHQHDTWTASDGIHGVCMMAPSHIQRCIKLLLTTLKEVRSHIEAQDAHNDGKPDIMYWFAQDAEWQAENKLRMFLRERNKRIKDGRWLGTYK